MKKKKIMKFKNGYAHEWFYIEIKTLLLKYIILKTSRRLKKRNIWKKRKEINSLSFFTFLTKVHKSIHVNHYVKQEIIIRLYIHVSLSIHKFKILPFTFYL